MGCRPRCTGHWLRRWGRRGGKAAAGRSGAMGPGVSAGGCSPTRPAAQGCAGQASQSKCSSSDSRVCVVAPFRMRMEGRNGPPFRGFGGVPLAAMSETRTINLSQGMPLGLRVFGRGCAGWAIVNSGDPNLKLKNPHDCCGRGGGHTSAACRAAVRLLGSTVSFASRALAGLGGDCSPTGA
jgi:hypothetical protein